MARTMKVCLPLAFVWLVLCAWTSLVLSTQEGLGAPLIDDEAELVSGDEDTTFVNKEPGDAETDLEEEEEVKTSVEYFLSKVEQYERNKNNCTPGVDHNLGEGVVAQYGVKRYMRQAILAVNRANFMTRLWKGLDSILVHSQYFLYAQVRSMVEGDPDVFAAGNCYDVGEFFNDSLFCPYAFRLLNDSNQIMVKDLSVDYKYLTNASEFFFQARLKAAKKLKNFTETIGKYIMFYLGEIENMKLLIPRPARPLVNVFSKNKITAFTGDMSSRQGILYCLHIIIFDVIFLKRHLKRT